MNTETLENIIEYLDNMSDDHYSRFNQFKLIQFTEDGSFLGGSHYHITDSFFPELYNGVVYNITPMGSQYALKANLQHILDNPDEQKRIDDPDCPIPLEEIQEFLFGMHSDCYNQLSRFLMIESKINQIDYEAIFRRVYSTSWKNYRYRVELREIFKNRISHQGGIMTQHERDYLSELPDKVKIYRVMSEKEAASRDYGVSWSLDRGIAERLGEMYFSDIYIHSGFQILDMEIDKSDIVAYFNDYGTMEIIYLH
jgi:hypothetical protein